MEAALGVRSGLHGAVVERVKAPMFDARPVAERYRGHHGNELSIRKLQLLNSPGGLTLPVIPSYHEDK